MKKFFLAITLIGLLFVTGDTAKSAVGSYLTRDLTYDQAFINFTRFCIDYNKTFTDAETGEKITREIRRRKDGICSYIEKKPKKPTMKCEYPPEMLSPLADYYSSFIIDNRFDNLNKNKKRKEKTYIVGENKTTNPVQYAIDMGYCEFEIDENSQGTTPTETNEK